MGDEIRILDEELLEFEAEAEASTGAQTKIVVERARGKLHAQLFDDTGQHVLADTPFRATLPTGDSVEGRTDAEGALRFDEQPFVECTFIIDEAHETVIPVIRDDDPAHRQVVFGYVLEDEEEPVDDEEPVLDLLDDEAATAYRG